MRLKYSDFSLLLLLGVLLLPAEAVFSAENFPACVSVAADGSYQAPGSLKALLKCQAKGRRKFSKDFLKQQGSLPSDEMLDALDASQQAEVQDYLNHYPNRAPAPIKAAAKTDNNQELQGDDLQNFKKELDAQSDGGKNGVTPQMAAEITQRLEQQEGTMSPDMRELLQAVEKDGPNLTQDTVLKLQQAAKQAKAEGLDLGIDSKVEYELLSYDGSDAPAPAPAPTALPDVN